MRPKLFIEGTEIDLFDDERIEFKLNIKDFKQFDKTLGSYTQPFTVPASKNNNKVFEHYYNASINTSFNPNVSRSAVLEINNVPYKSGFVKLEKAEVRNGQSYAYQIVFYDRIIGLKETLGDERLHDIGWTYAMDVSARYDNFSDTYDFSGSLRNAAFTPLIGSNKFLRYTDDATDDFDRATTRFLINESKPAVSVKYILDQVQTNYGLNITYPDDKIGDPDGPNVSDAEGCLYLWCNREEGKLLGLDLFWQQMVEAFNPFDPDDRWDSATSRLTVNASGHPNHLSIYQVIVSLPNNVAQVEDWEGDVCAYRVDTGEILDIKKLSKNNNTTTLFFLPPSSGSYKVEFYFRTAYPAWLEAPDGSPTFDDLPGLTLRDGATNVLLVNVEDFIAPNKVDSAAMRFCDTEITSLGKTYVSPGQLPSIKVFDFLIGLAKMFNWVLVVDGTNYTFKTLDNFYSTGTERDWTEYVDQLNYTSEAVDFFGEIKFLYEPSEAILSERYYNTIGGGEYGYGDLVTRIEDTNGDLISSESYEVKVPFSTMIWERPVTSGGNVKNFYIGNAVNEDNEPVALKPLLMYYNGRVTINDSDTFKLNYQQNSSTEADITQVHVASDRSDLTTSFDQSLNFGTEINIATNESDASGSNTLYNVFYEDFITDLYDLNARNYTFDAVLPLGEVLNVELNDTITIGFTKYFINSISVDLTTGKAKLNLRNVIA